MSGVRPAAVFGAEPRPRQGAFACAAPDARLVTQTLLEGGRQPYPYPTPGPMEGESMSLGFAAFLAYVSRHWVSARFHSKRLLHILDNRVSSCVIQRPR